jgi:hypothetical protein
VAEHEWKKGDAAWWSHRGCWWCMFVTMVPAKGVCVNIRPPNMTEYDCDRDYARPVTPAFSNSLRPRDPAQNGKDKPTAESEAKDR